jgi:hypothetical protein
MNNTYSTNDPSLNISHSPILIKFVRPYLQINQTDESAPPVFEVGSKLTIKVPAINVRGQTQIFPESLITILIPTDGILKFKLYPTAHCVPAGRYEVKYYLSTRSVPIHTEEWIVPVIHKLDTYTLTHNASVDGDKLPDSDNRGFGIFDIESVSHPGEYRLVQDKIQWINNPPSDGQKYTITYRPALTLQHIHVDSFNESSRGWTY